MAQGLGFVISSYLQSRSLLNPTGMAVNALNRYREQLEQEEKENLARQEAEMRAMVSRIQNLRATFENGKLVIHLGRAAVMELIEDMLKKTFATQEAGTTASFRVDLGANGETDHEGELALPSRKVFLKFVPEGRPLAEFAVSYLERARSASPSEYWLLTPDEDQIDFPFEPVFTENKITRGRLRTYNLTRLISDLVGVDYEVAATYDADGGFRFVVSKKQEQHPPDKVA